MKLHRIGLLILATCLGSLGHAQFSNTGATAYSAPGWLGQSFTTPDDGTDDLMTAFTWLAIGDTPMGVGTLYVFDQEYLGLPTDLAAGSGLLAVSNTYLSGAYNFSSPVHLEFNTQYWVYSGSQQQVGRTSTNLAGEAFYYAVNNSTNFAISGGGTSDATYLITATAIPEPSTYAMMAGVAALGLAAWRRREMRPAA
jgi:hypothetical protein